MPVVLLVSTGTANAAEVFAAALGQQPRARLVGEPTAGIAGVQRLVQLPEGHGLWLTYAQYLQADGTPIHQNGLRPDVPVEVPSVGFDETPPATRRGARTGARGPEVAVGRAAETARLRAPTKPRTPTPATVSSDGTCLPPHDDPR